MAQWQHSPTSCSIAPDEERVHLDLRADNVDEELDRLLGLGAHVFDDQASDDVVILQDPARDGDCESSRPQEAELIALTC